MKFLVISLFSVLSLSTAGANNCIAHRGDNENYLENSPESFRSALDLEAHGIEFDLQHTRDGVALVTHDKTLERTSMHRPGFKCPLKKKIKKINFKTIQQSCLLKNGSEILTLADFFELIGSYPGHLFIELKDEPSVNTLALIAEYRADKVQTTRFISFKKKYLKKARKQKDRFPLYGKMKMLNINLFFPFAGMGLGLDVGKWGKHLLFWARWWKKEIGIWTVDKVSHMKKLFKRKIPFVTTNRIAVCMEISKDIP